MNNHYDDAVSAYYQYCNDNGIIFQQPCPYSSVVGRKYVYLNNINGLLARYIIASGEITV